MSPAHNRLCYNYKPISSMPALSRSLGVPESTLQELARTSGSLYRLAKPVEKSDKSIRQTFDALPPLKKIHRLIKTKILSGVAFPGYLTGSIKGKDYKSNAALHLGARIVICEDISSFFPSTTAEIVFDVWHFFFGFSKEVSNCLARLTTKDGVLPQGAITSSDLANLVFWRDEVRIHEYFARIGVTYSRYVDDIALSAKRFITPEEKTSIVSTVYGMLASKGYKPKRRKHELRTNKGQMFVTKLLINERPALTRKERSAVRSEVFHLEHKMRKGNIDAHLEKDYRRGLGRVSTLMRFHKSKGEGLMQRMRTLRPFM